MCTRNNWEVRCTCDPGELQSDAEWVFIAAAAVCSPLSVPWHLLPSSQGFTGAPSARLHHVSASLIASASCAPHPARGLGLARERAALTQHIKPTRAGVFKSGACEALWKLRLCELAPGNSVFIVADEGKRWAVLTARPGCLSWIGKSSLAHASVPVIGMLPANSLLYVCAGPPCPRGMWANFLLAART